MIKKFLFNKEWFFEDFFPEEPKTSSWGFVIEKKVYSSKSKYQKIEVFDTKELGRVLVLDGMVQFTTRYEHIYHEMLVHPALLCHLKPKNVLIIGGGDGPALREVFKHPVKEVFLVDIDKKVTEVSKKYFQSSLKGVFKDKRLKIFHEDALLFIKKYSNFFDIIIEDLTDPTPVAKFCWNIKFYKDIFNALKEDGIASFQSGQLKESFAKKVRKDLSKTFPFLKVHKAFVNDFPFDEHTFSFGSKKINFNSFTFEKINKKFKKLKLKTKYYSPEIHFASQVLPRNLS